MAKVDLSENNGGALVATAITFLILSWFSVVLRSYVRAFMTKGFQADDWLMLVAQASLILLGCANPDAVLTCDLRLFSLSPALSFFSA